jgi:hypothetical protein
MPVFAEDRGNDGAKLIVRQGTIRAQRRGVIIESGHELGHGNLLEGSEKKAGAFPGRGSAPGGENVAVATKIRL